jgi:hypothetical protein
MVVVCSKTSVCQWTLKADKIGSWKWLLAQVSVMRLNITDLEGTRGCLLELINTA